MGDARQCDHVEIDFVHQVVHGQIDKRAAGYETGVVHHQRLDSWIQAGQFGQTISATHQSPALIGTRNCSLLKCRRRRPRSSAYWTYYLGNLPPRMTASRYLAVFWGQMRCRRRLAAINDTPAHNNIMAGHSRFEAPVTGKVRPATVIGCLNPIPLAGAYTASV
ncbi:MAG: hypothetical protein RLZ37_2075 [Actinomycetota bacterium]